MMEREIKHLKIKELDIEELRSLASSTFSEFEGDDDEIEEIEIEPQGSSSTDVTDRDLKLDVEVFIEFNSQIFEMFNNNNKNDIMNDDDSGNDEILEPDEDYDPEAIVRRMFLEE